MRVDKLSLSNFRGYVQTDVELRPGINVIAGINGSGKSSLLDALRILLSRALREITQCRTSPISIDPLDVRVGASATDLNVVFAIREESYTYFLHFNRQKFVSGEEGEVREQTTQTPDRAAFSLKGKSWREPNAAPFALFFASNRSVVQSSLRKGEAVFGVDAVYSEALAARPIRLRAIAEWWFVHQSAKIAWPTSLLLKQADALEIALKVFLPEFAAVNAVSEETAPGLPEQITIRIEKGTAEFDIRQLSDGERGMLALVLEIARRLGLAYPEMENPVRDGEAVILIDEIELHLHPKWQREIIQRLERTFPHCQFIITTHSPLVISQVKADRVTILEADGKIREPVSTLGLPAGEILESVQEVPPLHKEIIADLMDALDEFDIDTAVALLEKLRSETDTPNQLVSEMESLIGNTRALLEDAESEDPADPEGVS